MLFALLMAVTSPLQTQTWNVGEIQRTAIIQSPSSLPKAAGPAPIVGSEPETDSADSDDTAGLPATTQGPPLIFVFHGHGGTAVNMARKDFATHWPEAYFVFPQGLNTKSYYDPEGKRTGWQNKVSNEDDRDLKFFDAMLETMLAKGVDPNRVYVTGHSNGGYFSYLLWAQRHDKLAAIASSAGGGADGLSLQPLPAMHLAGREDAIVRFTIQERTMEHARRVNRCEAESTTLDSIGDQYASTLNTPFVEYVHGGGHEFLSDAPNRIVAFFKMHARPVEGYPKVEPIQMRGEADRFSQFDANGDGKIDTDELQRPFLFRVLDTNKDGFITRAEANSALGNL
jgi:polyhydroxybutyrate depolymerase